MTSREQFEAKCLNGLINGGLAKHENGKYASELTDAVWRGWQASREAVEIELPDTFQDQYSSTVMLEIDVVAAIEKHGIKVNEEGQKNG